MWLTSKTAWLWMLSSTLLLQQTTPAKTKGKCMHCQAVGVELQRRLDAERPRNHLDLRHRLDAQGNRYGKVIDYKVSELRAVELMDGLCDSLGNYELMYLEGNETEAQGRKGWNWIKTSGAGAEELKSKYVVDRAEMKSRQRDLENFCGKAFEYHDEDLTEAITGGKFETIDVPTHLCEDLMKVCAKGTANPAPAQADAQQQETDQGAALDAAVKTAAKEEL